MSRDLLDLVRELNTLNDDNLADRVIENSDVQWCLSELQDILEEMSTLTPPNEWVRVEKRLPEKHAQVLMWSAKWKIAEAGSYYNQHFWVYSEIGDGYIADNITHWMPLPAPPDRRPPEGEVDA